MTIPARPVSRAALGLSHSAEMSPAAAEVFAAVLAAQQRPRSEAAAVHRMHESTAHLAVAERAYFRQVRNDTPVSGISIYLARELARCWGNIDYGVKELARDDDAGRSEMLAYAWDLETGARSSSTFISPHSATGRRLVDAGAIYENNANSAARRLREQILAVLPAWFVEDARARVDDTLQRGGGETIERRRATALDWFAGLGVTAEQLAAKLGKDSSEWTGQELGRLAVIFRSIERGEISAADEFPPLADGEGVTVEDLATSARRREPEPAATTPAEPETASRDVEKQDPDEPETVPPTPGPATREALGRLEALLIGEGVKTAAARRAWIGKRLGRSVRHVRTLRADEVDRLVDHLETPADERDEREAADEQDEARA